MARRPNCLQINPNAKYLSNSISNVLHSIQNFEPRTLAWPTCQKKKDVWRGNKPPKLSEVPLAGTASCLLPKWKSALRSESRDAKKCTFYQILQASQYQPHSEQCSRCSGRKKSVQIEKDFKNDSVYNDIYDIVKTHHRYIRPPPKIKKVPTEQEPCRVLYPIEDNYEVRPVPKESGKQQNKLSSNLVEYPIIEIYKVPERTSKPVHSNSQTQAEFINDKTGKQQKKSKSSPVNYPFSKIYKLIEKKNKLAHSKKNDYKFGQNSQIQENSMQKSPDGEYAHSKKKDFKFGQKSQVEENSMQKLPDGEYAHSKKKDFKFGQKSQIEENSMQKLPDGEYPTKYISRGDGEYPTKYISKGRNSQLQTSMQQKNSKASSKTKSFLPTHQHPYQNIRNTQELQMKKQAIKTQKWKDTSRKNSDLNPRAKPNFHPGNRRMVEAPKKIWEFPSRFYREPARPSLPLSIKSINSEKSGKEIEDNISIKSNASQKRLKRSSRKYIIKHPAGRPYRRLRSFRGEPPMDAIYVVRGRNSKGKPVFLGKPELQIYKIQESRTVFKKADDSTSEKSEKEKERGFIKQILKREPNLKKNYVSSSSSDKVKPVAKKSKHEIHKSQDTFQNQNKDQKDFEEEENKEEAITEDNLPIIEDSKKIIQKVKRPKSENSFLSYDKEFHGFKTSKSKPPIIQDSKKIIQKIKRSESEYSFLSYDKEIHGFKTSKSKFGFHSRNSPGEAKLKMPKHLITKHAKSEIHHPKTVKKKKRNHINKNKDSIEPARKSITRALLQKSESFSSLMEQLEANRQKSVQKLNEKFTTGRKSKPKLTKMEKRNNSMEPFSWRNREIKYDKPRGPRPIESDGRSKSNMVPYSNLSIASGFLHSEPSSLKHMVTYRKGTVLLGNQRALERRLFLERLSAFVENESGNLSLGSRLNNEILKKVKQYLLRDDSDSNSIEDVSSFDLEAIQSELLYFPYNEIFQKKSVVPEAKEKGASKKIKKTPKPVRKQKELTKAENEKKSACVICRTIKKNQLEKEAPFIEEMLKEQKRRDLLAYRANIATHCEPRKISVPLDDQTGNFSFHELSKKELYSLESKYIVFTNEKNVINYPVKNNPTAFPRQSEPITFLKKCNSLTFPKESNSIICFEEERKMCT